VLHGRCRHLTIIFCVRGNGGGQRHHTERLAPYFVESCLFSSSSALGVAGRSCSSLLPLPFSRSPARVVLVVVGWFVGS